MLSHERYLELADYKTAWRVLPGFSKDCILFDWLHLGPLGFLRDYVGSVCIDLLERDELSHHFGTGTRDQQLDRLWAAFRKWCRDTGRAPCKGSLSLRSLGRSRGTSIYPELSSAIKAAGVQSLTLFVSELLLHVFAGEGHHCNLRQCAAWGIVEFIVTSQKAGLLLSRSETERMLEGGRAFVDCYAGLAREAATHGVFLWKMRPKLHFFEHLLSFMEKSRLNPQKLANWADESYMGAVKKVVVKCSGVTALRTSMLRYFMFLALRWEKRERTQARTLPV